jgi:CubicO group peptidase (beta-lactamase class C family)
MKPVKILFFCLLLAFSLSASPIWAKPEIQDDEKLGSLIKQHFAKYDRPYSPGIMIAVIENGTVIHMQGFGRANREMDIPWTSTTRYRMASMTKSMLAQAAFELQTQGVLSIDDPVSKYVTDTPKFMQDITLRHLIVMTSGLRQDELIVNLSGQKGFVTLDEMWAITKQQGRLDFEPGTFSRYADTNSRLLTRALEAATGKSFADIMQKYVFGPADMKDSLSIPYYREMADRQGSTYIAQSAGFPLRREVAHPSSGDGAVVSTMGDMVKWLQFITRKQVDPAKTVFEKLSEPYALPNGQTASYAHGSYPVHFQDLGLQGWGHGGASGTHWTYFPQQKLGIILFSNYEDQIESHAALRSIAANYLAARSKSDPVLSQPPRRPRARTARAMRMPTAGLYINPETGEHAQAVVEDGKVRVELMSGSYTIKVDENNMLQLHHGDGDTLGIEIASAICGGSHQTINLIGLFGKSDNCYKIIDETAADNAVPPVGIFYSTEIGSVIRVEHRENTTDLLLGPGIGFNHYGPTRMKIEPTGRDSWKSDDLALMVKRDSYGHILGIFLSMHDARLIWYGLLPMQANAPQEASK